MKRILTILAVIQLLMLSQAAFGQGWINWDVRASSMIELPNQYYFTAYEDFALLDQNGQIVRTWDETDIMDCPFTVESRTYLYANDDGSVLFTRVCRFNNDSLTLNLGLFDDQLNVQWVKKLGLPYYAMVVNHVERDLDNRYILTVFNKRLSSSSGSFEIWRFNNQGDFIDSTTFDQYHIPVQAYTTSDGGYLVIMEEDFNPGGFQYIRRLDAAMDSVWEVVTDDYIFTDFKGLTHVFEADSLIFLNGTDGIVFSIDLFGDVTILDTFSLIGIPYKLGKLDQDSYYVFSENSGNIHNPLLRRYSIGSGFDLDVSIGDVPGSQGFDIDGYLPYLGTIPTATSDGGYMVSGLLDFPFIGPQYPGTLFKLDSTGNIFTGFIQGTAFVDSNANCVMDAGEKLLPNWIIEAIPDTNATSQYLNYFGITDSNGNYSINADTGYYDLYLRTLNDYWAIDTNCVDSLMDIHLTQSADTFRYDIAVTSLYDCPYLEVNITTPFIRRCFPFKYTVSYANFGSVAADSAYIVIQLDHRLNFQGASIPWHIDNSELVFEIGDLTIGELGTFTIDVTYDTSCTETVIGQTVCVEAHIYPDSICTPLDPVWDGSTMEVEAICENEDTVRLLARNSGPNPTSTPRTITIVEDNVMLARVDSIFLPNQKREWTYAANGKTYTIMAKQSEGHPLLSTPIAAVEGCGVDSTGNISLGFITPLPPGDEDPFIDIDCQENTGAYDPNDKTPTPKGVGMEGYISQGQKLDYKIRFQNTGTDTAFNIWIRDTLPQELDITTLQLGASSHSYTFKIQPGRVLEWTFLNILLPDSFVNEPASNGFVQFSIQQADSLQPGTMIENSAAIFFDFNAPVITNTTLNTIVEDFATKLDTVDIGTGIIQNIEEREVITIYPNPNQGQFTIELQQPMSELTFTIYDAAGKQLMREQFYHQQKLLINKPDYGSGLYLYELTGPDGLVARGKIVMH